MALPSGSFSSPNAGQLFVNFSGAYSATSSDFGTGTASDITVRCEVRDDSSVVKGNGVMSRLNGGCTVIADYPGGNVVWSTSMVEITHNINGAGSVSLAARISVRLAKR